MIRGRKIEWLTLFLIINFIAGAQTEQGLLPFSNNLLLNPSYAGWNKNTSLWNSILFSSQPEKHLNHSYTLTFDGWSEKLKGGVAVYFYQGLYGKINTNTSGLGFTFSKPLNKSSFGQFIPSFHFSAKKAFKQWFVHVADGLVEKEFAQPSPPGKEFLRNNIFQPQLGLIWRWRKAHTGIAASYTFHDGSTDYPDVNPLHLVFHISGESGSYRKGLMSQPCTSIPQIIVVYDGRLMMARAGYGMESVDKKSGLYVQSDFSGNIHGISGVYGWKLNNFCISLSAGSAYAVLKKRMTFMGEANLSLIIPYVDFDKNKPWAVPKRNF